MRDVGARGLGGQRGGAGVREQIQHLGRAHPVRLADAPQAPGLPVDELPVGGLLGKNAHVLEGGEAEAQGDVQVRGRVRLRVRGAVVGDSPLVVHLADFLPGAAVLLAGLAEAGARPEHHVALALPFALRERRRPQGLRLRTPEHVLAEALQLLAASRVDQLIVFPVFRRVFDGHGFCHFELGLSVISSLPRNLFRSFCAKIRK